MGILLQIIGVLMVIGLLVYSVISIISKEFNYLALILMVVAVALIKIGRNIYKP